MSSAPAKFKCWTPCLSAFPVVQEYLPGVHLAGVDQGVLLPWMWLSCPCELGCHIWPLGLPAKLVSECQLRWLWEQACSELLPQLRFLIIVDYIWVGCSDWGEQSVLSQASTVVQISHQMFLIQAQNLLFCPQGKSGSMLLSIAAAGPVSRLGWAGSSVNQYDVWLLLMSPDHWHV